MSTTSLDATRQKHTTTILFFMQLRSMNVQERVFHSSTFHGSNGKGEKASADENRTPITIATTIPTSSSTSSSISLSLPPSTTIMIPSEKDVLCGRGGAAILHPGNKALRALVNSKKSFYQSLGAGRKSAKQEISKSIVATVRNNGGRFLQILPKQELQKQTNSNSNSVSGSGSGSSFPATNTMKTMTMNGAFWCEIGDKKAIAKTGQALRELTKNEKVTRKKLASHASSMRSAALRQTVEESKSKPKTTKEGRNGSPATALEKSDRRGQNYRRVLLEKDRSAKQQGDAAMAKPKPTTRESSAVLNGVNGVNGVNGPSDWEWKLFDFCDEEQTRQDDQSIPHQTAATATAAPCPSTCFLSREQQRQQQQLSTEQMLTSPRLCGRANLQLMAPSASMPQPLGASPVKKE